MIRQLVAALDEVGIEIDAETVADGLWLARARREKSGGGDRQAASAVRGAPTEPRPPDAEPQDPADDTQAESAGDWGIGRPAATSQAGYESDAEASSITLRKARALPGTLELGRALRPLKQRHPSKRGRVLNADATVEYFCDTGVLTPVMLPGAERWFDVDVLVDVDPSMAVWQDTAAEFVSLLQRHGAFREVRQWNLEQAEGKVRLSRAADVRSKAAQLVDPHARRLIMLVTDCVGPMWYQAPIWDAIREWGLFSPAVVISPLPSRLWPGTALGSPGVTLRSHRPGAANRSLDVALPWWWPDNEPPLSATPVPVITLDAGQVATWARMVMGAGGVESLGVFATPPTPSPSKAVATSGDGPPDAEERVRRFRVTVSPVAYRLAVYLSAVVRGGWGLELARALQGAFLPDSGQVHLAEVLVGGLVRQAERPEGQEELAFEFIDGVVNVLQRSLTGTEALRVLQALGAYIERETGRSPGIAAMLLGETAPADAGEQFEDVRAGAANLIQAMGLARGDVISGRATEAPSANVAGEPAATLRKSEPQVERVVRVIGFVDGQRQVGSGYRVTGRFVLTTAHCVRGGEHRVWLSDGEYAARVVADGGPDIDLALLDIGPSYTTPVRYIEAAKVAPRLHRGEGGEGDYEVDEEKHTIQLLESGVQRVEDWLGLDKLYDPENILIAAYLDRALRAKEFFKRDRDYVVMNGEVLMVDQSTGQIAYGRRYSEGIHQAIEAKEGVAIKEGSQPPVAELPPTRCARVDRNVPGRISGCVAVGFPQYNARAGAPYTASQVDGWIPVGSGLTDEAEGQQAGLLTLNVEGVAPRPLPTSETELGRSVRAGMSGAAVFANGLLVGVVTEYLLPDGGGSLSVVPIESVGQLTDASRARILQALGVETAAEIDLLTAVPTPDPATVLKSRDISILLEPAPTGGFTCTALGSVAARTILPITATELAAAVQSVRRAMTTVVQSVDDVGRKIFDRIDIPSEASDSALRTLARAGSRLFQQLFLHPAAGVDARKIGEWLREKAMDPGLRLTVQIFADRAPLPWALLYLGDASSDAVLDWNNFLGMRHIIEQLPLQMSVGTTDSEILSEPSLAISINVNTSIDRLMGIPLVARHQQHWRDTAARAGLTLVSRHTKSEVVHALCDQATGDQILYFCCIATAGTDPDASAIIMGEGDEMTVVDLHIDAPTTVHLAGNPLVFINACESTELSPLFYNGFVPYFMAKGARGVIGTECNTPALFAIEWADAFFDQFLDGAAVGETVLRLRQDFLREHRNPLGLNYAIHCDADIRVAPGLARKAAQ